MSRVHRRAVLTVAAIVTAVSGCGSTGTESAGGPTSSTESSHTSSTTSSPSSTAPTPTAATPVTAGHGRCVDTGSAAVTAAIGSLAGSPGGGGWTVEATTDEAVGSCPDLLWVMVGTPRGTVSSPYHVLFFDADGFLRTATPEARAYTRVSGSSRDSVAIDYRWLIGDEALASPSGGPVTVTFSLNESEVSQDRQVPSGMAADPCASASEETLEQAVIGSEAEQRLIQPVDFVEYRCAGNYARAKTGSREASVQATGVLFRHDEAGGWMAIDIGSSIDCTGRHDVPPQVAAQLPGCR